MVVPIKAFTGAKARLAPALSPAERTALARRLAAGVIGASRRAGLDVLVATDDDEVASWAAAAGARPVPTAGLGLDGSVQAGVGEAERSGAARIVVAHADLPAPARIGGLARMPGVTLVPDRHDDGTNALSVPAGCGFRFAYGPGSFRRHLAEARRLGAGVRVWRERGLAWDVDVPADLAFPA